MLSIWLYPRYAVPRGSVAQDKSREQRAVGLTQKSSKLRRVLLDVQHLLSIAVKEQEPMPQDYMGAEEKLRR